MPRRARPPVGIKRSRSVRQGNFEQCEAADAGQRQLRAVHAATLEITQEVDFATLSDLIHRRAAELLGATRATVLLWDEKTESLIPCSGPDHPPWISSVRLKLGEGATGTVALRRQGLLLNDYHTSSYAHPAILAHARLAAFLAEPLLYRDRLLGVIAVADEGGGRAFTREDALLLRLFAAHAAVAIENARLVEATRRRVEHLAILNRLLLGMAKNMEPQWVAQQIMASLQVLIPGAVGRLWELSEADGVFRLVASIGLRNPSESNAEFRPGMGLAGIVAATAQPISVPDIAMEPRFPNRAWAKAEGLVSSIGFPLVAEERPCGILAIYTRDAHHFTDEEVELLRGFAAQAAIALSNARLHAAIRHELAERRRAELELRKSEERFRAISETARDPIFIKDRDLRYIHANRAAQRFLGRPAGKLLGRTDFELFGEEMGARIQAVDRQVLGGKTFEGERTYVIRGVRRVLDSSKVPMRNAAGEIIGLCGISRDVTRRKQTDEALRKSNEALGSLIQVSPLAIVTLDLKLIIRLWNPAAERLFGWRAVELLGRHYSACFDDSMEEVGRHLQMTLREEHLRGVETKRRRKDGSLVEVSVSSAPLRESSGRINGVMVMFADISARKQAEAQLVQAQKMEALGRLAGGVAHDFNNLLMTVLGYSDLLLERSAGHDPSSAELIREIRAAGERAAELTGQLLAFSRRQAFQSKTLNLNVLVSTLEKTLLRLVGEDVRLVTALAPDLGWVCADPGQLTQVILNLAVNARDAMPQGGTLTITTANPASDATPDGAGADARPAICLTVSDTGCGMKEEVMAHLFEPFFTTKEAGKGTGLGLAIIHGIVQQGGGEIRVESAIGQGTTVRVLFPQVDPPPEETLAEPAQPDLTSGSETILLVEDNDVVRALVAQVLWANGYTTLPAADGPEAIQLSQRYTGPIHLLMTDVVMPKMSGPQLADHVRSQRPEMKVLYLSGYTDDVLKRHGVPNPDVALLQKPLKPALLARKVREILDG